MTQNMLPGCAGGGWRERVNGVEIIEDVGKGVGNGEVVKGVGKGGDVGMDESRARELRQQIALLQQGLREKQAAAII